MLADDGVASGLHITSPVVSPPAIARLMALNARTDDLMCVVDNPDNVAALGRGQAAPAKPLDVIIDIDPGIRRTGVGLAGGRRRAARGHPGRAGAALRRRAVLLRRAAAHRGLRRPAATP